MTSVAPTERLSGLDAGFLYMETPSLHMHTLKVAILDRPDGEALSFEAMKAEIGARLPALEPLRRRVLDVPFGFHHPVWVDDPDLDLDHHVRRVVLPSPGTRRQLDEVVGRLAGVALDRQRPLWQLHVIEGLDDGRLAILAKVHHAVADGSAASALLASVMSPSDRATAAPPDTRRRPSGQLPTRRELLARAFRDHLVQLVRLPGLLGRTLHSIMALVRHRRDSQVSTPVPIVSTPRTSFNTALSPSRSFASASLSLDEVREVKDAFGVTLNDVVLAVVAGALRTYLLARHELPAKPLVAGVPVGVDGDGDVRLGGNQVSTLFTTLATDVVDPVDRLRAIHLVTAEAKTVQSLLGTDTFGSWVQYTPPRPYAWLMRVYSARRVADRHAPPINVVVSNVPGPKAPLHVAGAHLTELYSVGPVLEGIGLNITVWSYVNRLFIGVLAGRDNVADPSEIAEAMTDALRELVASARHDPVVPSRA